ncbi:uncharacterized protein LOC127104072 [Lathyrus oleraceus]|uniref:uncharacterized protein LOC127104072 n=1 Tax=Pisum sativum TaxID=3888 RepID=UPI0021CEBDB8|nr:uncharacterized protein LOC127104072 [Pisum sativum]
MVTRSGKSTEKSEENAAEEDGLLEVELEIKEPKKTEEDVVIMPIKEKEKVVKPIIKLRYPSKQKKKDQHENNFEKFLEMFKKLEINIPFSEALEQMPIYAKFMKDIISKKRSMNIDLVILTKTCSAILQGMKIPVKKKDMGSVTIPCTIGDRKFKKALIDLGASVTLWNCGRCFGKVDKFVFPIDFVILEMPEDEEIPLILDRPFLETRRCMIDIDEEKMTLKVYDEELKIDVRNTMQYKDDVGTSHTKDEDDRESEVLAMMEEQPQWIRSKPHRWEDLRPPQPSENTQEPKKGENLKQLPENLKYVFLDAEKKCLTIINSSLKSFQEEEIIKVLKKYKSDIG